MMDGRSMFVLQSAITLMSAPNSQYAGRDLTDVVGDVLGELAAIEEYLNPFVPIDEETFH